MKKSRMFIILSVLFGFVPSAFSNPVGQIGSLAQLTANGGTECSIRTKMLEEKEKNVSKQTIKANASAVK